MGGCRPPRLQRIRTLVAERRPSSATARLLLFAANGFDRNLVNAADTRHDVELIDLERMYRAD